MKNLVLACLSLTLLGACATKDADPQPAPAAPAPPAQAATLNVAFDYYANATLPASTESRSLLATKPTYQVFPDRLEVTLDVLGAGAVQDRLQFVLPLSRQKSGLVGTYTLASQPDASLGEVLVTYTRPSRSSYTYDNKYGSNQNQLAGSLLITGYDATRHLLSGSYSVKATNVKEPFSFVDVSSAGDPRRSGDLRLSGTFQEIALP